MILYAVATGIIVPRASFPPAAVFNDALFYAVTGLPVQLIRGILITLLAIHIWVYYGRVYCSLFPDLKKYYSFRNIAWFSGTLAAVLCAGWIITTNFGEITKDNLEKSNLIATQTVAATLNPLHVTGLSGTAQDFGTPQFTGLKKQLASAKSIQRHCRFTYLVALRNERVVFLVDAEPPTSKDYSPPGQLYDEATQTLLDVFANGLPAIEGPVSDRWGTWVSTLVPIKDIQSNTVLAVLGQDIDAGTWHQSISRARLLTIFITLLVIIIVVGFFILYQRDHEAATRITGSEARYRGLVESSPNTVCLFDRAGCFVSINQAGCSMMGRDKATVLGKYLPDVLENGARSVVEHAIRRVIDGEKTEFEAQLIRPDGGFVVWYGILNPVVDTKKRVSSFIGVFIDITGRKQAESEREKLIHTLQDALHNVKLLSGLVPICASCKKIRDDKGYWNQIELYIEDHSEALFSHGICPECMKKLYPDFKEKT
jgi:PAS domain S-box-containing protein